MPVESVFSCYTLPVYKSEKRLLPSYLERRGDLSIAVADIAIDRNRKVRCMYAVYWI